VRGLKQSRRNISTGCGVGCCREGNRLQLAELGLERCQSEIFGTEIVAPLGDAVGLVDRKQADLRALKERHRVSLCEPFGRNIDEAQITGFDALHDVTVLGEIIS
jgi:hypothetical protein